MANRHYPIGRKHFADKDIDWLIDNFKVYAIEAGYVFDEAHEFVTSLGVHIVARSANLTGKTSTGGILKCDAASFLLLTGARVLYLVIAQDTGADATSPLLYYIDTATNLPFTPNGIDTTVQFDPTTGAMQV